MPNMTLWNATIKAAEPFPKTRHTTHISIMVKTKVRYWQLKTATEKKQMEGGKKITGIPYNFYLVNTLTRVNESTQFFLHGNVYIETLMICVPGAESTPSILIFGATPCPWCRK